MFEPGEERSNDADAHDRNGPDATRAGAGFGLPRFVDDVPGDVVGAAEIAELRAIRAGLIAEFRVIAAAEARRARLLARASQIAQARMGPVSDRAQRGREMELRSIAAELGMATRVNDRAMQAHIGDAEVLVRRFGATVDALGNGRISRAHASAIADAGGVIDDDEARAAFEQVALEHADRNTPAAPARSRGGWPSSSTLVRSTSASPKRTKSVASGSPNSKTGGRVWKRSFP